jgi:catechol 2,3-dioxygenase-like lactoylglutathione lyase family enzyme
MSAPRQPHPFHASPELAIHVPDLAAAEAFYGDVLGFQLITKSPAMLQFDAGGIMLFVNKDAHASKGFIPSLKVTDVDAARATLQAAGCEIVLEYPDSKGFYFRDPLGMVVDVMLAG